MTSQPPPTSRALSEQDASIILQKTLENAKNRMEGWVDGNGIHKSSVRISEKQLTLQPVVMTTDCRLVPLEKETRAERADPSAIQISNRGEMQDAIRNHLKTLLARNDIIERLVKFIADKNYGIGQNTHDVFDQAQMRFVLKESCQSCQGTGQGQCQNCSGSGKQACQQCKGQGKIPCFQCKGMKRIPAADGTMEQCHECNGFGATPCPTCHEAKYVTCSACQGSKKAPCKNCNATGARHVIITVDFKAEITGTLAAQDGSRLPLPADDLIKTQSLYILPKPTVTVHADRIETVHTAGLPSGTIGFSLNGKRIDTTITGCNGHLQTDKMFMDSLVKPGIAALNKIARGPMATAALFGRARSYRMVRDVTDKVSRMPRKKILHDLKQEYPVGLSDKYAKAMIKLGDVAIGKITVRPRWIGTGIGVAVFSLLIFAWFHLGLRPEFLSNGSLKLQLTADSILLGIGVVGCSFIIKKLAHMALKNMLGSAPSRLPKSGDQALIAFGILALVFLIAAASSPLEPLWIDFL